MTNPNAKILIVPKEQGADNTDTYFGSIGDATQRHVGSLSNLDRMLWESVFTTRDGKIFRPVPSLDHNVHDTLSLKGKDLDKLAEKMDLNIDWIKEEFAAEAKRREESEDALDRGELISFEDHEKFPGMTQHIDIPSTPRDRFQYLGNCSQSFYDEFPEGHPATPVINTVLSMLNRDVDLIDEDYGSWVKRWISSTNAAPYVRYYLRELVDYLVEDGSSPDEKKASFLYLIDQAWRVEYANKSAKSLRKDTVLSLLLFKEREWKKLAKQGRNVYPQIKAMGHLLFSEFSDQMRRHHWERYRRIKRTYSPKVLYNGINVNHARPCDLAKAFNCDMDAAREIWHHVHTYKKKGPFQTLAEVFNYGYITRKSFVTSENLDKLTIFIEVEADKALENKDQKHMSTIAGKLVKLQKSDSKLLLEQEWKTLWVYYRLMRDETNKTIQAGGKND